MSKTIIDVLVDSVADCVKVTADNITKKNTPTKKGVSSDSDGNSFAVYLGGLLGGSAIAYFTPYIGIPVMLVSAAGGVMDILLSDKEEVALEVVEDVKEGGEAIKYDIFKCLGCKNALQEYPEFIRMEKGGYLYTRPEGLDLSDIRSNSEAIRLGLNLKKADISLPNNKTILIKEYVDKIGAEQPYINNSRDTSKLIAYLGVYLNETGTLTPLEINFTKNNHMMVASTSGWGKSSILRTLITDLMLNYSPEELKFYFIDMKMTELVLFEDYKHCVGECITEHGDVLPLLTKLSELLKERKRKIKKLKLQNIYQYNQKYPEAKMNYILLVIDELYEVVVGKSKEHKEINEVLALLLSQGRAFGMYFILSTQHPSRKLIDASIQSNVAQRIGLKVQSETDSDVVFPGASIPLHDIAYKGRGYFGGLDGTYKEFQSYYIGDPELGNEPEVIADLLKDYLKPIESSELDAKDVIDGVVNNIGDVDLVGAEIIDVDGTILAEVAPTVEKPKKGKGIKAKATKNKSSKEVKETINTDEYIVKSKVDEVTKESKNESIENFEEWIRKGATKKPRRPNATVIKSDKNSKSK